jgi:hypothetical protein
MDADEMSVRWDWLISFCVGYGIGGGLWTIKILEDLEMFRL